MQCSLSRRLQQAGIVLAFGSKLSLPGGAGLHSLGAVSPRQKLGSPFLFAFLTASLGQPAHSIKTKGIRLNCEYRFQLLLL